MSTLHRVRHIPSLAAAILVALAGALFAQNAGAQSISSFSTVNQSTANEFNDGLLAGYERSSTITSSSNASSFSVRYAWVVGADTGLLTDRTESMTNAYQINFQVNAPGSYRLDITTGWHGSMTTVDDGDRASADVGALTGSQTGGTLSGSLSYADPGSRLNSGSTGHLPFDLSTTGITITGTSNGVNVAHQLSFQWTSSCNSDSTTFLIGSGAECAVRGGLTTGYGGETASDYPGQGSRTQANDGHFVTATLVSFCNNGVVDGIGEQCDAGAGNNGAGTSCCTSTCQFRTAGQTCRASAGICDTAETCPANPGVAGACPANAFQSSATVCRGSAGVCDIAENCPGNGPACPGDTLVSAGTECRASAGVCDVAEQCTGSSPSCPTNQFVPSTTVCRGVAGVCDNAENCPGNAAACPADGFKSSSTVCRGSAGVCDIVENCTGSGADCPLDAVQPSTTVCRGSAGVCDIAELCDGVNVACPTNIFQSSSTVCRGSAGVCDIAENCTGSAAACPAQVFEPSTTVCRAAEDVCDREEKCFGNAPNCPVDTLFNGTTCRAVAGVCDVAEICDGVNKACPAEVVKPSTTECRATAGFCDLAENCDGSSVDCPTDVFKPSTTECRAQDGVCDIAESCTGSGAQCPTDTVEPSTTVCRPSVDVQCDPEERCDGQVAVCPPEVFEPNGLVCDDGDPQSVDENCFNGHCGCTGQDIDGDNLSDNCDTEDTALTIKKAVAYATRTKPGRIKANGTIQQLVYGPNDLVNPSQGFLVTITDGLTLLHVRSLAQADCKVRPTGTIQCRTDDNLNRLYMKPNRKVPGELKWKLFFQDLQIDQPQAGPITIVIEQTADLIDRVGSNSNCKVTAASLACK